jgi:hypothetical protein
MSGYIDDADYTAASMWREIKLKIEAHSYVTPDEWEAYYRAEDVLKQQQALWENGDGLLTEDHDTVRWTDQPPD